MKRLALMTALAGGLFALSVAAADTKTDATKVKKGLQNIGEFVGQWNLIADSTTGDKRKSWKETVTISWKFKGDDSWFVYETKGGPENATGELRYHPDKKNYTLTLTRTDKTEVKYSGEFKEGETDFRSKG